MNSHNLSTRKKAFTLIEVLVVIALISFLAAITIIAINPAKNFQDARNTQRRSDTTQLLNAVTQYITQQGNSLSGLGTIATCPATTSIGTSGLNLTSTLVPTYLVAIPTDPSTGTAATTGYTICQTAAGRITVAASNAESTTISVSR